MPRSKENSKNIAEDNADNVEVAQIFALLAAPLLSPLPPLELDSTNLRATYCPRNLRPLAQLVEQLIL